MDPLRVAGTTGGGLVGSPLSPQALKTSAAKSTASPKFRIFFIRVSLKSDIST
jgi:hypothetical protein